jgi:hypothetical protein
MAVSKRDFLRQPRRIDPPSRMTDEDREAWAGLRSDPIAPEVLQEFGVSRLSQLAGHVEDARRELLEGMKLVDRHDERDLYVWVGSLINTLDDLRCHMAERERKERS